MEPLFTSLGTELYNLAHTIYQGIDYTDDIARLTLDRRMQALSRSQLRDLHDAINSQAYYDQRRRSEEHKRQQEIDALHRMAHRGWLDGSR